MNERSHPTRGYKSCMAILAFSKTYGADALERACSKAVEIGTRRVDSIETMLKRKTYLHQDIAPLPINNLFNSHENLRGSNNYQ